MNTPKINPFHKLHDAIERGFIRWGEICYRQAWWVIAAVLAVMVYFSTWLPQMQVDLSTEGFLHKGDPVRITYNEFREEFGRDEKIVLLIEKDAGIVSKAFLTQLKSLHEELEEIPQVHEVDSLINARLTLGRGDELIVKDLMEDWPQTGQDYAALKRTIESNPLYLDQLVNRDLTKTVIVITPDTYTASYSGANASDDLDDFDFESGFESSNADIEAALADTPKTESLSDDDEEKPQYLKDEELSNIILSMDQIIAKYRSDDIRIGPTGSPVMMHLLTYILGRDMFVFSGIGILIISVLLMLIFRRWVMVILPVTVSALSLYFTFTLMSFFGVAVTTSVQILPSLLLAVGVGNSVHLFNSFYQGVDRGMDKKAALSYALGHSGMAVVMTGLTTAGGLTSFVTADIKPVSDIGIVSPMGIICTLLFSLILLPALIAVTPMKNRGLKDDSDSFAQRFLHGCGVVSTRYPRAMILTWFAALGISLFLASQLKPSHYPLQWFPENEPFRLATETMDNTLGGSTFTEVIFDTGEENGLHDPELLKAVDEALIFARNLEVGGVKFGKGTSLLDINKELHQALNGNDPDYYVIPDDEVLIAQELLLFENSGSDDLEDIVDSQFSKMRVTVTTPQVDSILYPPYLDALETGVREIIGDKAEVTFTGIIPTLGRTVSVLISDTIKAYLLAFLIITPLMMFLVGSLRTGLIAMIPNMAPIIFSLALMVILGIPLDAFTLLVGSIALGLAVDDTIHFMHNYQRFYLEYGDAPRAVQETLKTTGRALFFTSLVLVSAFLVNLLATMSNLVNFGILTAFCILMAFLADVLLAPALMTVLAEWKDGKPDNKKEQLA